MVGRTLLAIAAAGAMLGGCAMTDKSHPPAAPEPAKPVNAATFYSGRWYEIGRTPMGLTDGCVAGTTDYLTDRKGRIQRDACRSGKPSGKEKVVSGRITFLNAQNTKLKVDYRLFGFVPAPRTYWILDHGEGWFLMSDPPLRNLNLYTRDPRPPPDVVAELKGRAAAAGYDVRKLEFPDTFPPGQK